MGTHHARVLGSVAGATLVGVHDKHPERAEVLGQRHGCAVFLHLEDLAGACEAAIVATSSSSHRAVGEALLQAGIPCLIEKPLALNEPDCLALIAAAARRALPLAVGHTERFNPATAALLKTVAPWRVHAIETRRLNPGSARVADTGVVSDLMLHDLDIVLHVMQRPPSDVLAVGLGRAGGPGADHAIALLSFGGPALASCAASRIAAHRARELTLIGDRGTLLVDYLARTVRRLEPGMTEPVPLEVDGADALATELAGFVDTLREAGPRRGQVIAGEVALDALRLAWTIERELARR
jgi:predicted dehydrogenase